MMYQPFLKVGKIKQEAWWIVKGIKRFSKFVFWLCCLFAVSCNHQTESPPCDEETDLWPLKTGNSWTYLRYYFDPPDTIITQVTGTKSLIINGDTIIASIINNTTFYWNGPEGIYYLGIRTYDDSLVAKKLNLEFRCNANVGDTWKVDRPVYSEKYPYNLIFETQTYTLLSKDEELETPAGKFSCYVYQYTKRAADDVLEFEDHQFYFAQGIGMVGAFLRHHPDTIVENDSSFIKSKALLLNYDIK